MKIQLGLKCGTKPEHVNGVKTAAQIQAEMVVVEGCRRQMGAAHLHSVFISLLLLHLSCWGHFRRSVGLMNILPLQAIRENLFVVVLLLDRRVLGRCRYLLSFLLEETQPVVQVIPLFLQSSTQAFQQLQLPLQGLEVSITQRFLKSNKGEGQITKLLLSSGDVSPNISTLACWAFARKCWFLISYWGGTSVASISTMLAPPQTLPVWPVTNYL